MTQIFDYQLQDSFTDLARLALIVLQTDETIEHDLQRLIPSDQASVYVSRIANAPIVNKANLAEMAEKLPITAGLLPDTINYHAVGYGCTSATSVIGADKVSQLIQQGCQTQAVTNPLSALIVACQHLNIQRLAFLSPYEESVSDHLRSRVHAAGIQTPLFGTFNEAHDPNVARITADSVMRAAIALGQQDECDAIFLSCTNLRTLDVISAIEKAINKPVISSNQALVWHMARLAGLTLTHQQFGKLWQ